MESATVRSQSHRALATPLVYPFHWTAVYPLIGVALAENRIPEAVEYARGLLAPRQQRFPDTLTTCIQAAIQAWDSNLPETALTHLQQVATMAREMGYL